MTCTVSRWGEYLLGTAYTYMYVEDLNADIIFLLLTQYTFKLKFSH